MGYGDVGFATIKSAGTISSGVCVRIFDVVMGDTSNAVNIIQVFAGGSSSAANTCAFWCDADGMSFAEGLRFPNGAFVIATGCTATINYIREF
jgi:hypothetical protein